MKLPLLTVLLLATVFALPLRSQAQAPIAKMAYADIAAALHTPSDKVRVINLWATWCRPCVKELPYFEAFAAKYPEQVEVVLVSLDFPADHDSRLPMFVQAKGLKSRVIAVTDTDPNAWLHLVNDNWGGAIPATYIVDKTGNIVSFHEGEATPELLEQWVAPYLK
jgi:thiol-disulfide isomerase/thioredoxin